MELDREIFANFIKQIMPMADDIAMTIAVHFEHKTCKKDDFLLKEGQVSNDFYFLASGYMRSYTFDTEGNDVTTNFYGPNSIVFEVASYFKRIPSRENIQALNDCEGWTAKYDTLQTLFHSIPEFREFGRANLVNGFISFKERTLSMINYTAVERYNHLIKTRPDIFQFVPLKFIASYLGITVTSLSRIRKEIVQS